MDTTEGQEPAAAVQRRATRLIKSLETIAYDIRLKETSCFTLVKGRWERRRGKNAARYQIFTSFNYEATPFSYSNLEVLKTLFI